VITLRIEHAIHDYDQWKAAVDNFAQARVNAGVCGHTIRRSVEDPGYLMLDLEFDSADAADAFTQFRASEHPRTLTDATTSSAGTLLPPA